MTSTRLELLSPAGHFSARLHAPPSTEIASSTIPQCGFPMVIRRLMARLVPGQLLISSANPPEETLKVITEPRTTETAGVGPVGPCGPGGPAGPRFFLPLFVFAEEPSGEPNAARKAIPSNPSDPKAARLPVGFPTPLTL
jgi:hypothetical protein